jgi:hypothetical protein
MAESFLLATRVFDGHEVHPDSAVGIEDGRVTRVLPAASVPAGAQVQSLQGVTLMPGLIDAHVHLAPWMMFGLLAAGVTAVRDCGNDIDRVEELMGELPIPTHLRPSVEWSGPLLESDRVNWPSIARAHATDDEIRTTVDELADRGLRWITLYANATPSLMAAAASQAHRRGLRALGYPGASRLMEAVAARVDEVQHLAGCLAADLDLDAAARPGEVVAGADVDHCPTLVMWRALAELGQPRAARDRGAEWAPQRVVDGWSSAHHATQSAENRLKRLADLRERMSLIMVLRDHGRRLLVGSDAPFPGLLPGVSLHDEAGLLVQCGISELEVLRALTSGNAEAVGLADRGRLVPGAVADIVAVTGDPTTTIAHLSRVESVWKAGQPIDFVMLRSLAAQYLERASEAPIDSLARLRYTPCTAAGS